MKQERLGDESPTFLPRAQGLCASTVCALYLEPHKLVAPAGVSFSEEKVFRI